MSTKFVSQTDNVTAEWTFATFRAHFSSSRKKCRETNFGGKVLLRQCWPWLWVTSCGSWVRFSLSSLASKVPPPFSRRRLRSRRQNLRWRREIRERSSSAPRCHKPWVRGFFTIIICHLWCMYHLKVCFISVPLWAGYMYVITTQEARL